MSEKIAVEHSNEIIKDKNVSAPSIMKIMLQQRIDKENGRGKGVFTYSPVLMKKVGPPDYEWSGYTFTGTYVETYGEFSWSGSVKYGLLFKCGNYFVFAQDEKSVPLKVLSVEDFADVLNFISDGKTEYEIPDEFTMPVDVFNGIFKI